jgi:ATP-binding cassette subfamily F protein 3
VEDGQVNQYLGNYTDYMRALGRREAASQKSIEAPVVPEPVVAAPVQQPRRPSDSRTQKSISNTERDIARLEGKLNELSDALAIASIEADVSALSRLGTEYERVQVDLDAAYKRWEELSAALEPAI